MTNIDGESSLRTITAAKLASTSVGESDTNAALSSSETKSTMHQQLHDQVVVNKEAVLTKSIDRLLFPGLATHRWRSVNLDAFYQKWSTNVVNNNCSLPLFLDMKDVMDMKDVIGQNTLISAVKAVELMNSASKPKDDKLSILSFLLHIQAATQLPNILRTYGGFGENRKNIWKTVYDEMKDGESLLHLAVDFNNLLIGQPVSSLTNGTVYHIFNDTSKSNGWGGRIIIKVHEVVEFHGGAAVISDSDGKYVLYGHLDPKLLSTMTVGQVVNKGDIIGHVGGGDVNGGWFSHLHVQYMTGAYVEQHKDNLNDMDGYARGVDITTVPDGVLDPMDLFV